MSQYSSLKATVMAAIKQNGNQEITGDVLQAQLVNIINALGLYYQFAGIATPSINPGTPDQQVVYLAFEPGTYTNFGGIVIGDNEISILRYNGTWAKWITGAGSRDIVNRLVEEVEGTPANAVSGYYLKSNGVLVADENYGVSDYIPVPAGQFAVYFSNATSLQGKFLVFYDDNNNVIGFLQENVATGGMAVPLQSGATKFRFTFVLNFDNARAVYSGNVFYRPVFATPSLEQRCKAYTDLQVGSVATVANAAAEAVNILETSVDAISKEVNGIDGNAVSGYYLKSNGVLVADENYGVSDYIPVPAGQFAVYFSNATSLQGKFLVFYDDNNDVIGFLQENVATGGMAVPLQSGATKFRFTFVLNFDNARAVYSGNVFYRPVLKELSLEEKCKEYVDSSKVSGRDELMFTLIDDDFSNLTMCEKLRVLCNQLGIKCTFALIPDYSQQDPYTPSLTQEKLSVVQEYQEDGFSFAMHPNHNLFYMDGANAGDVSQCEKCLVKTQQYFDEKHIMGGSKILVWPGTSDTRTIDGVAEALVPMSKRHVEIAVHAGLYSNEFYNTAAGFKSARYKMRRMPIDFGVFTKTQMKDKIDAFVANGAGLMIFNCHVWQYVNDDTTVDETTASWPNFSEVLTYAVNKGIQFVNMNEVMFRKIIPQYMPDVKITR